MIKKLLPLLFISAFAQAEVNVAVVAPFEGEYSHVGMQLLEGAKIAINNINENGGINGQKINLIEIDDKCNEPMAISTAQMLSLIKEKERRISMIIGPYCNHAFHETADIYAKAGIFQIIPTSLSSADFNVKKSGLLKMFGAKENQVKDFYKYYSNHFTDAKVALVYNGAIKDNVQMALALQSEFKKNNKQDFLSTFNFENFDSLKKMSKAIVKSKASVAYIIGDSQSLAQLSKEIKNKAEKMSIFIDRDNVDASYRKVLGNLANGSYVMSLPALKSTPEFAEDLVKLRLQGVEPTGFGVYSYNAVKMWQNIATQAKSFNYNRLSQQMINMATPANAQYQYGIYKIEDLEYTQVY